MQVEGKARNVKRIEMMSDLNIKEMEVTSIQFFDYSDEANPDDSNEYSANIILDEKLVIQLSGNKDEAHKPSIPSAVECYYDDESLQDEACEHLDIDDVVDFLNKSGIENNFYFLSENGEQF